MTGPSAPDSGPDGPDGRPSAEALLRDYLYLLEASDDVTGRDAIGALLADLGADPDRYVLVEDPSNPFGYRVELKADYLQQREEAAALADELSRTLRYEYDVPAADVEEMGLPDLVAAFEARVEAEDDGEADVDGGEDAEAPR